jgi:hypothetical protein
VEAMMGIEEFLKFEKKLTSLTKECGIDKYLKMRDDRVAYLICQYLQNLWGIIHDRDEWHMFIARMENSNPAGQDAFTHRYENDPEIIAKHHDKTDIPHDNFSIPNESFYIPKDSKTGFFMGNESQGYYGTIHRTKDEIERKLLELEKKYDELWDIVESLLTEKKASLESFPEPVPDESPVPVINFSESEIEPELDESLADVINFFESETDEDPVPVINFPDPEPEPELNESLADVINSFEPAPEHDPFQIINFPEPAPDEKPVFEKGFPDIALEIEPAPKIVQKPKPEPSKEFKLEPHSYNISASANIQENCIRIGHPEAGFHISCFKCDRQRECQNSHENQRSKR